MPRQSDERSSDVGAEARLRLLVRPESHVHFRRGGARPASLAAQTLHAVVELMPRRPRQRDGSAARNDGTEQLWREGRCLHETDAYPPSGNEDNCGEVETARATIVFFNVVSCPPARFAAQSRSAGGL